jgi:hypothetical protein
MYCKYTELDEMFRLVNIKQASGLVHKNTQGMYVYVCGLNVKMV